ncbi:MAG: tRNA (N(6)-L-threonylcarbamoyladenosine(37)-C(2))-methylthiotransferase MtaB [Clostridia bacterium]|nr:tRNA (N(6)-L-threonylcarbamoyladenosine(37)-C(2))-methylthiotransferase MtaB [Clostridia bacterium]
MKFFIYTFGCKTNTYESEAMSRLLLETGKYEAALTYKGADAVIVNSCMVTEESEKKARKLIRRIRRENPSSCILLCGCMPQVKEKECLDTGADIICGNTKRADIPSLIDSFFESKEKGAPEKILAVAPHEKKEQFEMLAPSGYKSLTRANLKIEDGCDCYCSYCVIPFARGHVRSMPIEEVLRVAKDLVGSGHREIVLTGINIGMYGRDIGVSIYDAVKVAASAGAERVRLGSVEIDLINDETILKLSQIKELCPHFHTSLQSGSDSVLKAMHRRYDAKEYLRKINLLRGNFENASITTDVIVGFPGETEEDFLDTVSFVKKTGFFRIHVFPYSRRPGTVAANLPNQVPQEEKKRRVHLLEDVAAGLKKDFLNSQIGKTANVLFERIESGTARGHAENYVEVRAKTKENVKNQILKVKIKGVSDDGEYVIGDIVT